MNDKNNSQPIEDNKNNSKPVDDKELENVQGGSVYEAFGISPSVGPAMPEKKNIFEIIRENLSSVRRY